MSELVNLLFKTKALKVSPEDRPFWYTSGKLGPYYINTHFLYGSEEKANELLALIDTAKNDILTCPKKVFNKVLENYNTNEIYKKVMDIIFEYINTNIDLSEIEYISGGERRDWFFSNIMAYMLKKPHITIYKDLKTVVSDSNFTETKEVKDLNGTKTLHIADLITEASSYERAWIPAIKGLNAEIASSVSVVDRLQGGKAVLSKNKIESYSLIDINKELFVLAEQKELINEEQKNMILDYIDDPNAAMKKFLSQYPNFLENELKGDNSKNAERAKLCIESKLYE